MRDPIRLGFALFGTVFLMVVFGFGISTDVNNLTFAVIDHDQSHESRAYLEELRGSAYFTEQPPLADYGDIEKRLKSGDDQSGDRNPAGFRTRPRGRAPGLDRRLGRWRHAVSGRDHPRLSGGHAPALSERSGGQDDAGAGGGRRRDIEIRFKYNQNFESVYAMVPISMSLMLALFPAILMAVAVVREKELGSITNLYVTPVRRIEFLLGKQVPYIGLAMINFCAMFLMALFVFQVPLKGSLPHASGRRAVVCYDDHVVGDVDFGVRRHADRCDVRHGHFDRAAGDAVLRHAGAGIGAHRVAQLMGRGFPMTYFVPISVGTFTKGLGMEDLWPDLMGLAIFIPVLTGMSLLLLRKQER